MAKSKYYIKPPYCRVTVCETYKQYIDNDTGKFVRDKIPSILGQSLGSIIKSEYYHDLYYIDARHIDCRDEIEKINKKEIIKTTAEVKNIEKIIENFKIIKISKTYIDQADEIERRLAEIQYAEDKLAESQYQKQLRETEIRLANEKDWLEKANGKHKQFFTNIITTKWIPK